LERDLIDQAVVMRDGASVPLLLLLSREHLTEEQQARARALAAGIGDWPGLIQAAVRLRCLPFVHRHVVALGLLPEDSPLIADMQRTVTAAAFWWLRVAGAQAGFLDRCIAPLDAPYLILKGLSVSALYDNPQLRTSRDIDILVHPDAFRAVLDRACEAGYRVILDPEQGLYVESPRDLEAVLRFKHDIPLVGPENVMVELHRTLHIDLQAFDLDAVIGQAQTRRIAGRDCRVMPTNFMFPYVCAHHTRHLWDTPSYAADIDTMQRHPDWDAAEAADWADRAGLRHVTEAALRFEKAARTGPPLDALRGADPGPAARSLALFALQADGGAAAQARLKAEYPKTKAWIQKREAGRLDGVRAFLAKFRPSLNEYIRYRLPIWLSPLYWVLAPLKLLRK
jgi:hypothetical protein